MCMYIGIYNGDNTMTIKLIFFHFFLQKISQVPLKPFKYHSDSKGSRARITSRGRKKCCKEVLLPCIQKALERRKRRKRNSQA